MRIIDNIVSFFKQLFYKKDNIKMIEEPLNDDINEKIENSKNDNFINSLKNNVVKKNKKQVETLICVGDGLGIQNKISY